MSSDLFSTRRFMLLCKQHLIHNSQFLLLSTVAYIGVIFIVLSLAQLGEGLRPHSLGEFQAFMMAFVAVFGILYAGHAFPAFRAKESTINYLMVPASEPEKFAFEFLSRIGFTVIVLPLLFWITFHLQGFFFAIFTEETFQPLGIQHMVVLNVDNGDEFLIYCMAAAAVLLAFVLAFTGAAMFSKQPLVKSLFAVAVIVMFFVLYSYIMITQLGIGEYNPPECMLLVPLEETSAFKSITGALLLTTIVMLVVAFRKLKEREV